MILYVFCILCLNVIKIVTVHKGSLYYIFLC